MNSLQLAIERERRNADMWRVYRPHEAAKSEARIKELQTELAQVFHEEVAVLTRYEEETRPVPGPQPVLTPLGIDEYVSGQWIKDDASHTKRPR